MPKPLDILAVTSDVASYLQAQGFGVVGKTIYKGPIPAQPLAVIGVLITGGSETRGDPLRRPSLQILCRDASDRWMPVLAVAQRIWALFDQKVPPLASTRARFVPDHVPGPWYRDVNQNVVATLNFGLVVNPA